MVGPRLSQYLVLKTNILYNFFFFMYTNITFFLKIPSIFFPSTKLTFSIADKGFAPPPPPHKKKMKKEINKPPPPPPGGLGEGGGGLGVGGQTSQLLDQIGPVCQFGENRWKKKDIQTQFLVFK